MDCEQVGQVERLPTELSQLALPPKSLEWASRKQLVVLN